MSANLIGTGARYQLWEDRHGFKLVRLSDNAVAIWYGDDACERFRDAFKGDEDPDDTTVNNDAVDEFGDWAVSQGHLTNSTWSDHVVRAVKLTDIRDMIREGVRAGREVFGDENMDNKAERLMRFGEEALELLQAGGFSEEQVYQLVAYVYDRPKEQVIGKEFAGSLLTLFAAASAHGEDLVELFDAETKRILAKKDQCRAKHAAKPATVRAP